MGWLSLSLSLLVGRTLAIVNGRGEVQTTADIVANSWIEPRPNQYSWHCDSLSWQSAKIFFWNKRKMRFVTLIRYKRCYVNMHRVIYHFWNFFDFSLSFFLFPFLFFFFLFLFRIAASPVQAGFCLHGVKSCVNYSESQLQPSLLQAGEYNKEITTCRKGIKTMSTTVRFLLQAL